MALTYYFHDYETFGADPRRDRPAQFAGIRTDADFNVVAEPTILYCRPPTDYLPDPEACLITGITPQLALEQGVREAEFAAAIHREMSQPQTCALGYNSIRFDDEFTRHLLYRNLYDPYEREWQGGNSRWDLIDLTRLVYALRPEGIEWPRQEDGRVSFRLERLTAANGLAHEHAHDALSDVYATIGLARLLKEKKPRLFDFVCANRDKRAARELLALGAWKPLLHVSEKYPASRGCLAMVVALAPHPENGNGVLVYDLGVDPTPLIELDAGEIRRRLFTPVAELGEGAARIPLKTVHVNKCPVLAPLGTLKAEDAERWQIDLAVCMKHLEQLKKAQALTPKLHDVFVRDEAPPADPELALYSGFLGDRDRRELIRLRNLPPDKLAGQSPDFDDPRLPELFFRYRARNWPETLSAGEKDRWEKFRRLRLMGSSFGGVTLDEYRRKLKALRAAWSGDVEKTAILEALERYPETLQFL
ncbi:MAG TPA: exodeoxyribonuclease I [Methylococcaceae bacterium]|nr:exodeoxyribonuclease I [Methylococcaceae bacterium]